MRSLFSIAFLLFVCLPLKAQLAFGVQAPRYYDPVFSFPSDTFPKDTVNKPKYPSPKTAAILSACLPGLGQIYNRRFGVHSLWKVPVIYAGFGGLAYGFAWNQKYYAQYRDALRIRYDGDSTTVDDFPGYTDDNLVTLKNYYQRYRDLCVIGAAALYTLQILDATVDAHLATFDVGDNLSLHVQPSLFPGRQGMNGMISLRLSFR